MITVVSKIKQGKDCLVLYKRKKAVGYGKFDTTFELGKIHYCSSCTKNCPIEKQRRVISLNDAVEFVLIADKLGG